MKTFMTSYLPWNIKVVVSNYSACAGRDPKVRAGAVDVVRHWQDLGYLIIYVTGTPPVPQYTYNSAQYRSRNSTSASIYL